MQHRSDAKRFFREIRSMTTEILSVDMPVSIGVILSKLIVSILPLSILWLIKTLVDKISSLQIDFYELLFYIILFCIIQIAILVMQQVSSFWESRLQNKTLDYFSNRIIEKSVSIDYTYFENPAFQNTLFLAQNQARFRINQLLPAIYGSFGNGISLIFIIAFFIGIKAYFFLLILILALPITLQKWYEGKKMNDLDFTLSSKERESNYIFQSLTGLQSAKEVRLYNFEKSFQNKYNQIRTLIVGEKMKIQKSSIKKNTVIGVLEILFAGGLFAYLGYDVLRGSISLGLFILYLQGTQRLQTISKGFFQSLLQLFQLRLFVKDLHAFLNLSENKNINPSIQELEINSLSIRNLSFRYPGNTIHTLENINLNAQKGKIIALVGENGSGKSTLVKLLAGLYNPAPDSIFVNNNDLLSVPKPVWYRQSAVLFQDFEKYFFEVDKNIHFDLNESNNLRKESIAAASQSLAHEFILNLSKQYDTRLGNLYEGSEQLSGGQWQKLALARIFFKDRPVVILDEPSSALDAFAELSLYENIKNSFSNKIVIIVSHRLYNLKIADYIYVLSHGKIAEEGNFNDLIQQNGLFYSMYEKQKI